MNKLLEVWHFQGLYYHCQAVLAGNVIFKKYEWSLYTDALHTPNFLWKANLLTDISSSIKTFTINFSKSHDSREQNWWTTAVLMVIGNSTALSSIILGLRTDQTVGNILAFFLGLFFTPFISSSTCWGLTGQPFPANMSYCPLPRNSAFHPHVKSTGMYIKYFILIYTFSRHICFCLIFYCFYLNHL